MGCSAWFTYVLGSLSVDRKVYVEDWDLKLVHDWMPKTVGSDSLYTSSETFHIGIINSLAYV